MSLVLWLGGECQFWVGLGRCSLVAFFVCCCDVPRVCDSGWVADGTFACCCDLMLLFGLIGLSRGCRVVFLVISDLCGCWCEFRGAVV